MSYVAWGRPSRLTCALLAASALAAACNCDPRLGKVHRELALEPKEIDFGEVVLGTVVTRTVTLSNRSATSERITAVKVLSESGEEAADFFAKAPGDMVPGGGSMTIEVSFQPTFNGLSRATLEIESEGQANGALTTFLSGTGVSAYQLVVTPTEIDFGNVLVDTKKSVTVTLYNNGTRAFPLAGLKQALVKDGAGMPVSAFVVTPPELDEIAAGGGELKLEVSYAPKACGEPSGKLLIDETGPEPVFLTVKGSSQPRVRVVPPSIDFGTVDLMAKKLVSLQVTNVGYCVMNLTAALTAATPREFGLEQNGGGLGTYTAKLNPSPPSLAQQPGSTMRLTATFSPQMAKLVYQGEVELKSNDPVNPQVFVPLVGRANDMLPCTTGAGFNNTVYNVAISPTGIYYVGEFTEYAGVSRPRVAKTDMNCTLNPTFDPGAGFDVAPNQIAPASDGDVVIATSGSHPRYQNSATSRPTWKLKPDGTVEANWNPPNPMAAAGSNQILATSAMADMIVFGTWQSMRVVDLTGRTLFAGTGDVNLHGVQVIGRKVLQPSRGNTSFQGQLYPGGAKLIDFTAASGAPGFGSFDSVYTANAGVGANCSIGYGPVSSNGRHFIVSTTTQWSGSNYSWNNGPNKNRSLMDINIDGTENPNWQTNITTTSSFGDGVLSCAIDSMDRAYIYGQVTAIDGTPVTPNRIYRLTPTGQFDKEFGPFDNTVNGCALVNDDRILVYGAFTQYQGAPQGRIVFLHANGNAY